MRGWQLFSMPCCRVAQTLRFSVAPFDRWIEGDEAAISEAAKRGFALFNGKASCFVCHSEANGASSSGWLDPGDGGGGP